MYLIISLAVLIISLAILKMSLGFSKMKWEHLSRMKAYEELIGNRKMQGSHLQQKNDYLSVSNEIVRQRMGTISSEIIELQHVLFSAISQSKKQ